MSLVIIYDYAHRKKVVMNYERLKNQRLNAFVAMVLHSIDQKINGLDNDVFAIQTHRK